MHKLAKFTLEEQTEFLHLQLLSICLEDYFNVGFFNIVQFSSQSIDFFALLLS